MTVSLRLCLQVAEGWDTERTYIVSEGWWRRFLLAQERAFDKISLDKGNGTQSSILSRGTSTDGLVEQENRREQRTNEIRSGLVG